MKVRVSDSKELVKVMRRVKDDSRGKAVKQLFKLIFDGKTN